jgi:hypothetical protein
MEALSLYLSVALAAWKTQSRALGRDGACSQVGDRMAKRIDFQHLCRKDLADRCAYFRYYGLPVVSEGREPCRAPG